MICWSEVLGVVDGIVLVVVVIASFHIRCIPSMTNCERGNLFSFFLSFFLVSFFLSFILSFFFFRRKKICSSSVDEGNGKKMSRGKSEGFPGRSEGRHRGNASKRDELLSGAEGKVKREE